MGIPVKVLSVVYVALLGGICWLAKNKKLGKLPRTSTAAPRPAKISRRSYHTRASDI